MKKQTSKKAQKPPLNKGDVSSSAYWDGIKTAEDFLIALKENDVTFQKLKPTVFGNTASKVIRAIKKHGKPCFEDISKSHQTWWSTKHAICQALG